jgi:protein-S-isoprenylcysteine O-methyltransferase Ste14
VQDGQDERTRPVTAVLPTPFAIDRSAWLSGASYALAFVLALQLQPAMRRDVLTFGPGVWVLLLGVGVFFLCVLHIQRHMRLQLTATSFGKPRELVTNGPFAITRNPIYLAFLLPLAAFAYYSPVAALVAILIYLVTMTVWVVRREEDVLAAEFGPAFAAYRARTPRWFIV